MQTTQNRTHRHTTHATNYINTKWTHKWQQVIALNLPAAEIEGLKAMFASMDADGSGTITAEEMAAALKARGALIPEADLKRLMADADLTGDGRIGYEEFLAATLQLGKLAKEEHLHRAFQVGPAVVVVEWVGG